ncbi:hypothetical protein DD595_25690 [Enterobacter cloacae complex sp. 4DZ3-17B2]|nr:hypothetical protein DD595_25690 [Enterobacter cloacae complex sp. 4DZ3-17B2]
MGVGQKINKLSTDCNFCQDPLKVKFHLKTVKLISKLTLSIYVIFNATPQMSSVMTILLKIPLKKLIDDKVILITQSIEIVGRLQNLRNEQSMTGKSSHSAMTLRNG